MLRPASLLSTNWTFDAPLWPVTSLSSAGACYRALRRLPGQDFHLLEERVFQDAPCSKHSQWRIPIGSGDSTVDGLHILRRKNPSGCFGILAGVFTLDDFGMVNVPSSRPRKLRITCRTVLPWRWAMASNTLPPVDVG